MCDGWISQHRGSVGALACPHARPTGRNRKEVERWKKIGGEMKNLYTYTWTFASPIVRVRVGEGSPNGRGNF